MTDSAYMAFSLLETTKHHDGFALRKRTDEANIFQRDNFRILEKRGNIPSLCQTPDSSKS